MFNAFTCFECSKSCIQSNTHEFNGNHFCSQECREAVANAALSASYEITDLKNPAYTPQYFATGQEATDFYNAQYHDEVETDWVIILRWKVS